MTENKESKEEKKEEEVAEEAKPAQEQEKTKVGKKELKESFSVLLQYLRKYRKETIALSIFGIISAVGNGIVPYVAGRFFDSIITPEVVTFFGALMPLYVALLIVWAIVH